MTHEPIDDVLKALRDELAGVAPSPAFASRVRERVAGELPLLRKELAAVAPSPEFKARVRQQIEAAGEARRASWWSGRRWLVPATLAAGVLLAVMLAPRRPEAPAPMTPIPDLSRVTIVDGPLERAGATPRPKSVDTRAGRTAPPTAASLLRTSTFEVGSSNAEPSLEVITNQPAILRALSAQIAAGAQIVETTTAPDIAPEILVPPIEIQPIVVKPVAEPPDLSGVPSIIRKIAADMAERSDK